MCIIFHYKINKSIGYPCFANETLNVNNHPIPLNPTKNYSNIPVYSTIYSSRLVLAFQRNRPKSN